MGLIGVTLFKNIKPIYLEVIMPEWLHGLDLLCHTSQHRKDFMKPSKHSRADITSCYGMIETQKKSLTLKSWTDMEVTLTPEQLTFSTVLDDQVSLQPHTYQASSFCQSKNMTIFKITAPLFVRCKEDIQFVLCQTPFNFLDFHLPSGVVSFKYQQGLNIFIYVPKNIDRKITWQFDEALINIFPLSERKVKLKYIYDNELWKKYSENQRWFFLKHRMYKMGSKNIPIDWM